ncbi:UvrD-helicase domain-containing protein [Shewanella sp.]|uniref:UvrD-helicase domain-containing protein n=1 Tax=Shewanella sp. TaxID=50422 RepID=UPI001D641A8C|nr:UvrD-helicase domain-containing protein [Shewanella sp.]MCJ8304919.1 AAA family ATPase [Shewanella sp.]NQZ33871.1 AAA family ATPase [Oceanospirillaceae bacterium]
MDKRVILAVAGSGKTQHIINKLELVSRALIVTYTNNNACNLKKRILKKFGHMPEGIRVYTYFSFLMTFCVRPIVGNDIKIKGVSYNDPPKFAKRKNISHYIDKCDRIYHNRIAKFMMDFDGVSDISVRIEKYFDFFCVDEVQDFAANDFNLLCELSRTKVEILLVGDFYQHTFDTSRDGNTQKNLHAQIGTYQGKLKSAGFFIDTETLSHSYRCSPSICNFVSENIGIPIESHRDDDVVITFVEEIKKINELMEDDSIVKLFYQKSHTYLGWTDNWGNTKGLDDFTDVCIVLNSTTLIAFKSGKLNELASSTANKLYVACTRAKGSLYFVSQKAVKDFETK